MKAEHDSAKLAQLCDVVSIALGDAKYYSEVREMFVNRALGAKPRSKNALDPTDPATVELISNLFLEASKFH